MLIPTKEEIVLNLRQSLLAHGDLHKKYWGEPDDTQQISYGRWRQDLAEAMTEHLLLLILEKKKD